MFTLAQVPRPVLLKNRARACVVLGAVSRLPTRHRYAGHQSVSPRRGPLRMRGMRARLDAATDDPAQSCFARSWPRSPQSGQKSAIIAQRLRVATRAARRIAGALLIPGVSRHVLSDKHTKKGRPRPRGAKGPRREASPRWKTLARKSILGPPQSPVIGYRLDMGGKRCSVFGMEIL